MNILHVCYSDYFGGAARAAYRIHRACIKNGMNSQMAVLEKSGSDYQVWQCGKKTRFIHKITNYVENFIVRKNMKIPAILPWSLNLFSNEELINYINSSLADVVNLHWINNGSMSVNNIDEIQKPIVWTMHDAWPFTGGCHYFGSCLKYKKKCENCPQTQNQLLIDFTKKQFNKKKKVFVQKKMSIVGPSRWVVQSAKDSVLFKDWLIEVIPNTLDTKVYNSIDIQIARSIINVPQNKKVILFGANSGVKDPRKGYDLLVQTLIKLESRLGEKEVENMHLLVVGAGEPKETEKFPFSVQYMGRVYDDYMMSLLYNSADVFVAPSREDNLPNTILEASACGTPCVAFRIGGIPDLIDHEKTGYLAQPFDVEEFASGIAYVVNNSDKLGGEARKKVISQFRESIVAGMYKRIYRQTIEGSNI